MPRDVQQASGAHEQSSTPAGGSADRPTGRARSTQCVAVTREQFAAGRAVCDGVRGRLRFELRFTWLGGRRILERVDRARRELLT